MTKAALRKIYLTKQRSLPPAQRSVLSEKIAARFFQTFDLSGINVLHCFIPIEKFNEVDTNFVFDRVWKEFPSVITVVPRVNFSTHEMDSVVIHEGAQFAANKWGIQEPSVGDIVPDIQIDLVIVPGIAFDLNLHRVGYGKGFYDRFLRNCRSDCSKVGVGYFAPQESIEDVGPHDVQLDQYISPARTYSRNN